MKEFFQNINLVAVCASIIIVAAAIALLILTRKLAKRQNDKISGKQATIARGSMSIFRIVILAVAFISILQVNGVNVTAVMAGLGIASAIVGLALQDYLKDIIMGVHIFTDNFFTVGDCIEFEGREGRIKDMTLVTTKISDLDDKSVITVCNRNISQIRRLGERLDVDIPLSYGENVETVHRVLSEVCDNASELAHVTKCEYKGTQSFEKSSILYRLRVYCKPCERADVRRAIISSVQTRLNAEGIKIPFEQIDVHCDIVK